MIISLLHSVNGSGSEQNPMSLQVLVPPEALDLQPTLSQLLQKRRVEFNMCSQSCDLMMNPPLTPCLFQPPELCGHLGGFKGAFRRRSCPWASPAAGSSSSHWDKELWQQLAHTLLLDSQGKKKRKTHIISADDWHCVLRSLPNPAASPPPEEQCFLTELTLRGTAAHSNQSSDAADAGLIKCSWRDGLEAGSQANQGVLSKNPMKD